MRHLPSGLVVRSSSERSQALNRAEALRRLKEKLLAAAAEQHAADVRAVRGEQVEASFGAQIRNYVLAPYRLVKCVRSGYSTAGVYDVLDGDLEPFIRQHLLLLQAHPSSPQRKMHL